MKLIKYLNYSFLLFGLTFSAVTYAEDFDSLLKNIKQQTQQEVKLDNQRKQWFANEKQQQTQDLKKVELTKQTLSQESDNLKKLIDDNELLITSQTEELQRKMGDLGELFGVVRQVSGELKAGFEHSMISVHYPERIEFMQNLSETKELPDIATLEKMWVAMLVELDESRKIVEFTTPVVQKDGSTKEQQVIRIGVYNAVSEGDFLTYSVSENIFEKLLKQPSSRFHNTATNFSNPVDGFVKIAIDPTRGQLLNIITQKPTLIERMHQGGIVGYIIIGLGIIGLLIAALKFISLSITGAGIARQTKDLNNPCSKNALGRIALAYERAQGKSHEQKETLLDEAILKEVPKIEKYNNLVKLLATVSPLLGLLGTVIGMIITFQSITLFGTSDPKLMAGGISTALVTTVLGLTVAIPLLFAYTFIATKAKYIIDTLEQKSIGLIAKEY